MNKFQILSILLGIFMSGCIQDEANIDLKDNNFNDSISIDQIMPVFILEASQIVYDHAEYNIYLSQCLTTMGKSQTSSYPYKNGWEFIYNNNTPQWNRHYKIGQDTRLASYLSVNSTSNADLIARTIMLMSTQLTTDTFGEMPMLPECYMESTGKYGDAFTTFTPHYESQPDIYNWMFREADALIQAFENPNRDASADVKIDQEMDRIYNGDLDKWKGLVYAMKARLLLRNIPNVDPSPAMCNQIIETSQKAIDTWRSGDLLYGSWFGNEPRYNYPGGATIENAPWSPAQPKSNTGESHDNRLAADAVPSRFFMESCLGVSFPGNERKQGTWDRSNGFGNDPRIVLLMKPAVGPMSAAISNTTNMYRYLENNIGSGTTFKRTHYPDLYAGAYAGDVDAYNPLFTMEELYFMQAEAYYWLGNKAKACELAKEATKWNIQRHLDFYLWKSGGIYPTDFTANRTVETTLDAAMWKARFESYVGAFLNNEKTTVEYAGENANGEAKTGKTTAKACSEFGNERYFFNASNYSLSDLMMQKYIAMYMQPEQWNDMRRYHYSNNRNGYGFGGSNEIVYPTLRRPYNLYSAYWVDGLTYSQKENTWIQRLNYDYSPQIEYIYNKDELVRLGAYRDFKWLQKPMIWAQYVGVRISLTK